MEMGTTVAFQEDGSWKNEGEHQQRLRIRQVKESRLRLEGTRVTRKGARMTTKYCGIWG